jgi:hypothetical protein
MTYQQTHPEGVEEAVAKETRMKAALSSTVLSLLLVQNVVAWSMPADSPYPRLTGGKTAPSDSPDVARIKKAWIRNYERIMSAPLEVRYELSVVRDSITQPPSQYVWRQYEGLFQGERLEAPTPDVDHLLDAAAYNGETVFRYSLLSSTWTTSKPRIDTFHERRRLFEPTIGCNPMSWMDPFGCQIPASCRGPHDYFTLPVGTTRPQGTKVGPDTKSWNLNRARLLVDDTWKNADTIKCIEVDVYSVNDTEFTRQIIYADRATLMPRLVQVMRFVDNPSWDPNKPLVKTQATVDKYIKVDDFLFPEEGEVVAYAFRVSEDNTIVIPELRSHLRYKVLSIARVKELKKGFQPETPKRNNLKPGETPRFKPDNFVPQE